MMLLETDFAGWVLGIVGVLVVGGVVASVKSAIDVAVIKQILKSGEGRMDRIEQSQKRHSDKIRKLENPPSNPMIRPIDPRG